MTTRLLVLSGLFLGGAALLAAVERPEPAPARTSFEQFPMQLGRWRGAQQPPFDDQVLAILGVDDYLTRAYFTPDRAGVGLYIGYYGSQRQGDTMHSPQNCLPGAGWEPVSSALMPVPVTDHLGAKREIVVNRYIIQKGIDRQVVLYWYQAHDRVVANEYWAKYYLIRDAVVMNRTDGALVRVMAPYSGEGEAAAEALVVDFVKQMYPLLERHIPA